MKGGAGMIKKIYAILNKEYFAQGKAYKRFYGRSGIRDL
jgi:hypothetical protein